MRSKTFQASRPRRLVRRFIGKSSGNRPRLSYRHLKARPSHINGMSILRHELKTPLAGILGMSELLRDSGLAGEQRQLVLALQASGRQMGRLVEKMATGKAASGSGNCFRGDAINALELLEQIIRAHWPAARKKDIGLYLVFDHRLSNNWRSDGAQLRQLLDNLLANAIKFTHHGHVLVEARPAGANLRSNYGIVLSVRDTGIGISAHGSHQIYSICEQGSDAVSQRYGGSGLGLFVCDRIATALGGSVEHKKIALGGTCFNVVLPDTVHPEPGTTCRLRPALISGLRFQLGLGQPTHRVVAHLLRRIGVQVESMSSDALERMPVDLDAVICHPEHIGTSILGTRPVAETNCAMLLSRGFSSSATGLKNEPEKVILLALPQPILMSNLEPLVLRLALQRAMHSNG